MTLQDYKIEGDYIKVSKAELEKWESHYWEVSRGQDEDWKKASILARAML